MNQEAVHDDRMTRQQRLPMGWEQRAAGAPAPGEQPTLNLEGVEPPAPAEEETRIPTAEMRVRREGLKMVTATGKFTGEVNEAPISPANPDQDAAPAESAGADEPRRLLLRRKPLPKQSDTAQDQLPVLSSDDFGPGLVPGEVPAAAPAVTAEPPAPAAVAPPPPAAEPDPIAVVLSSGRPQTIGEAFRQARQRLRLELAEVGERTRIPIAHINAFEEEHYEKLPQASIFVNGYIRSLCRLYQLDPGEMIGMYERMNQEKHTPVIAQERHTQVELAGATEPAEERRRPVAPPRTLAWVAASMITVIALVLVIAAAKSYVQGSPQPLPPQARSSSAAAGAPATAARPVAAAVTNNRQPVDGEELLALQVPEMLPMAKLATPMRAVAAAPGAGPALSTPATAAAPVPARPAATAARPVSHPTSPRQVAHR